MIRDPAIPVTRSFLETCSDIVSPRDEWQWIESTGENQRNASQLLHPSGHTKSFLNSQSEEL